MMLELYRRLTGSLDYKRCMSDRAVDLFELATALHAFSKHSRLLPTTRLKLVKKLVKKQLKLAARRFEGTSLTSAAVAHPTLCSI